MQDRQSGLSGPGRQAKIRPGSTLSRRPQSRLRAASEPPQSLGPTPAARPARASSIPSPCNRAPRNRKTSTRIATTTTTTAATPLPPIQQHHHQEGSEALRPKPQLQDGKEEYDTPPNSCPRPGTSNTTSLTHPAKQPRTQHELGLTAPHSQIPHRHCAPPLHGHDRLLLHIHPRPHGAAHEHDQIRPHQYATAHLSHLAYPSSGPKSQWGGRRKDAADWRIVRRRVLFLEQKRKGK